VSGGNAAPAVLARILAEQGRRAAPA
jgi:hypothetical protein